MTTVVSCAEVWALLVSNLCFFQEPVLSIPRHALWELQPEEWYVMRKTEDNPLFAYRVLLLCINDYRDGFELSFKCFSVRLLQ